MSVGFEVVGVVACQLVPWIRCLGDDSSSSSSLVSEGEVGGVVV